MAINTLAHLTPDYESGTVYRSLSIPVPLLPHVNGALLTLCELWEWEEFGDMTPEECAYAARDMWMAYTEENPMIGVILEYVTNDVPSNCLPCDGSVYNRVDYPILYSRLDSAFIIDADTFETPNKVGYFSLGSEANIGEIGGEAYHTLSTAEMPSHTHQISNGFGPNVALSAVLGAIEGLSPVPTGETTTSAGSGNAHNNMPPYIKVRHCIVAR